MVKNRIDYKYIVKRLEEILTFKEDFYLDKLVAMKKEARLTNDNVRKDSLRLLIFAYEMLTKEYDELMDRITLMKGQENE